MTVFNKFVNVALFGAVNKDKKKKKKENFADNLFHNILIFLNFLMFYQIFLSPQVKRCVIIAYKHGIYEFPLELPNDFRLRMLGN